MTILQLAPRMPYPLTDGGAVGIFNITKGLALLGHKVTLLTFPLETRGQTAEAVRELSKYADVRLVSKPLPPRWRVLLRTIFHGAYPIERRMTRGMFELIAKVISEKQFDVVHIDHSHMGRYGLWIKERFHLPIVLRQHNFEAMIYERFANTEKNPLKSFVARVHGKRLKKAEALFLSEFNAIAAISQEDVSAMKFVAPSGNYHVIPAGVDIDYFQPSKSNPDPDNILSVGPLSWDPNFDATRYFLDSIFPLILEKRPQTILHIVGADSDRILPFTKQLGDSVQAHGLVPDLRDYLGRASVVIIPLRIGGGMRIKLLEFFASGKAVVSTSIGAEGIRAEDGVHLLVRDTPAAFANGVLELQSNAELQSVLGTNARRLAGATYAWPIIVTQFVKLYETVL